MQASNTAGNTFGAFALPVCCSAADARAAELSAATEALDVREQQLLEREATVQAATADLEGREAQVAQQKEDMTVQEVRQFCNPLQNNGAFTLVASVGSFYWMEEGGFLFVQMVVQRLFKELEG